MSMRMGHGFERARKRERRRNAELIRLQGMKMSMELEYCAMQEFNDDIYHDGTSDQEDDPFARQNSADDQNSEITLYDDDGIRGNVLREESTDAVALTDGGSIGLFEDEQYELRVVETADGQMRCIVRQPPAALHYRVDSSKFGSEANTQRYEILQKVARYLEENRQACLISPELFLTMENRVKPAVVYSKENDCEKENLKSAFARAIADVCISWGRISLQLKDIMRR